MAIDTPRVVARRNVCESRRGRRIVLASAAFRRLAPAGFGRLQERQMKLPFRGSNFLSLRLQWRNPAIVRIDDEGGARAGALVRQEHVVVGAGKVDLASALHAFVAAEQRCSRSVQLLPLFFGEKFLV